MGVVVALIALAVRRVDRDIADHPAAAVRPLGEVGSPGPARQWKEGKDLMAFPKALRLGIAAAPPAVAPPAPDGDGTPPAAATAAA